MITDFMCIRSSDKVISLLQKARDLPKCHKLSYSPIQSPPDQTRLQRVKKRCVEEGTQIPDMSRTSGMSFVGRITFLRLTLAIAVPPQEPQDRPDAKHKTTSTTLQVQYAVANLFAVQPQALITAMIGSRQSSSSWPSVRRSLFSGHALDGSNEIGLCDLSDLRKIEDAFAGIGDQFDGCWDPIGWSENGPEHHLETETTNYSPASHGEKHPQPPCPPPALRFT